MTQFSFLASDFPELLGDARNTAFVVVQTEMWRLVKRELVDNFTDTVEAV